MNVLARLALAWNALRGRGPASALTPAAAAPAVQTQERLYAGAEVGRLTADWNPINTSADAELVTSMRLLRGRCRQLVRDNEHAKNALRIIGNNIIGSGIGMQALVKTASGKLVSRINDDIESAWQSWCAAESCHSAARLSFADLEQVAIKSIARDGEVLIRKVKKAFGKDNKIPFALEIIEADRLVDVYSQATAPGTGNRIRMGVEIDDWDRPVAYWLYPVHPGDYQFSTFVASRYLRVPADEMIQLYLIDRWPQTRGEPWFHTALKRLNNMGGYEEAEIVAARASASIMGLITSPETPEPDDIEGGERLTDLTPGTVHHLQPGEQFTGFAPTRPNASLEPFMRHMLRAVAAGVGCSYESLSRDYSQSNYSSSRLALLDDRDLWRMVQGWFIRNFRAQIHREWLEAAVLAGELSSIRDFFDNRRKYTDAVRFKPRGWSWIDPTKEVGAYKEAVRCGFMTVADVISQTAAGADPEDSFKARREELDLMAELDLVFDTDPAQVDDKGKGQVIQPAAEQEDAPAEANAPEPDADDSNETAAGESGDPDADDAQQAAAA